MGQLCHTSSSQGSEIIEQEDRKNVRAKFHVDYNEEMSSGHIKSFCTHELYDVYSSMTMIWAC